MKPTHDRLHIGCGRKYFHGWVNVDLFSSVEADCYFDATRLPFVSESFSLIYACHILEHFHRHVTLSIISHWRELLMKGGVLRVAVPDFSKLCAHYQTTGNLGDVMGLLYGGQNEPTNTHRVAFDYSYLSSLFKKAGFTEIRQWDWKATDHKDIDDFSQCYLPHMDKTNGTCMSLNMEAVK